METISKTVNQTLETLGSLPTRTSKEGESPKPSRREIKHPARTLWQTKWVKLDCHCEALHDLSREAEAFCKRWFVNQPWPGMLVMVGESGCGKTHVARAIARYAAAAGFTALEKGRGKTWADHIPSSAFYAWSEITDGFKAGDYSTVQDMMDADLLVLDDVGAEHDPSKNATAKLCQILSRREKKFTVITTNIKPEEWPTSFDTRVADRLLRNSKIILLFGVESYTTNP